MVRNLVPVDVRPVPHPALVEVAVLLTVFQIFLVVLCVVRLVIALKAVVLEHIIRLVLVQTVQVVKLHRVLEKRVRHLIVIGLQKVMEVHVL